MYYHRLPNFLMTTKIISNNEFGSFKNKSTNDVLNLITKYLYSNIDINKPVIAAFLDLAKAFDIVNRNKLLVKLDAYGIRDKTLNLIMDYLENRYQVVKVNGYKNIRLPIIMGVPHQGIILGPLLFFNYINDILSITSDDWEYNILCR